jgi:hypothetical protein
MFIKAAILLAALTATANAAVVDFFNDNNCQDFSYSRNIYDNTCGPTGGFQSFRVTADGGNFQRLTAYSRNACAGASTACIDAYGNYGCVSATNVNGGSNAMSSGTDCGLV